MVQAVLPGVMRQAHPAVLATEPVDLQLPGSAQADIVVPDNWSNKDIQAWLDICSGVFQTSAVPQITPNL